MGIIYYYVCVNIINIIKQGQINLEMRTMGQKNERVEGKNKERGCLTYVELLCIIKNNNNNIIINRTKLTRFKITENAE